MPMIKCPDCNSEMSSEASNCPKCGKPNPEAKSSVRPVGFLLGIGIFFMPLIFSWFTLRKGHTTKAKVISFIWFGLCLAGVFGMQSADQAPTVASLSTDTSEVAKADPSVKSKEDQVMEVNIRDILSAYENNEVGADNKYKGKKIQVTGKVGEIKKDVLDNLYVTLGTGAEYELPQIQAFFADSMNNELGNLQKGQSLTVVGTVDGLMMNVIVNDCIIK
ncbi:MAG: hypothetical protein K9L83_01210 [Deltaproteobacteria bacterium]|nr:hypothetical protein [Deltaproteobacteria bacterium]